jgi:hypothetical protein
MFRKVNASLIIIGSLCASTSFASSEIQLFSSEGYPYQQLISRVDSVKIIFTEREEGVQCKVNVTHGQLQQETQLVRVTAKQFEEKPLASCLPRIRAKVMLASTF